MVNEYEALIKIREAIVLLKAQARVDSEIVKIVLPQAYDLINRLLSEGTGFSKSLVVDAKKLLPPQYANSFSVKQK